MPLKFKCPQCSKKYAVDEAQAGRKVKCGDCGQTMRVPGERQEKTRPEASLSMGAQAPPAAVDIYGLDEAVLAPRASAIASRPLDTGVPAEEKLPPRAGYGEMTEAKKKKLAKRADKVNKSKPSYAGAGMGVSFGAVLAIALFGWRMYRTVDRVNRAMGAGIAIAGDDGEIAPFTPAELKAEALAEDKEIEKSLRQPTSAEAREWLDPAKHPDHVVMEMSNDLARKMVDGFYDRGAIRVTMLDPAKFGARWLTAEFAVELPKDLALRKKCFQWEGEIMGDGDPTTDYGQKFIHILTD